MIYSGNCDIIIEQDYSDILDYHKSSGNDITVVSAVKTYSIPYGTIKTGENGCLMELVEKPDLTFSINSGMYLLEPHMLDFIPDNKFYHITHLIKDVTLGGGKVGVFPVNENSWIDMGDWEEYLALINHKK